MNIRRYETLVRLTSAHEQDFWLSAGESGLDFWKDPSNEAYETLA